MRAFTTLPPPSFPRRPSTSILIDGHSESSSEEGNYTLRWTREDIRSRGRRMPFGQSYHETSAEWRRDIGLFKFVTFDMLPDDVLLEIFNFYVHEKFEPFGGRRIEEWITLAHVCRRWRSVVFQSPLRLNLRLACTPQTPARATLDIWPPLPLVIHDLDTIFNVKAPDVDNIIAALEHRDRVCQIDLINLTSSKLEYVTDSAMQKPFPELTDLRLNTNDGTGPILSDSFLGGTAPRLRSIFLSNIPFPGLPKLLLSSIHLVRLDLYEIPRSGYIPPEAMATSLSSLTSLEFLRLHFRYPRPRLAPESRRPPPPSLTRFILPSLTKIRLNGTSEYLEEILARIDPPRLSELHISFFNQIIFDTPQLYQFISRRPTLRTLKKGHIEINSKAIIVRFRSQTSVYGVLSVEILCRASEWQLSSLEQVCTSFLPLLSTLEDLYIFANRVYPPRQDYVENTLWLELLHPFASVKNLYLCMRSVPRIVPPLQELVGGRTTEVLPTLQNIFLEGVVPPGPVPRGIEKLVAARWLASHFVAVSHRPSGEFHHY